MAEIRVENAIKRFGKVTAVDDVSLTVNDQEFVVLLGPSGCGKTTLLRAIAGLGMVDSGRIMIGTRDVTYLPPKDRGISMVFQSYAIFPHMKVYDNVAFGLQMKRAPKAEIEERVQQASKLLHIEEYLDRYPGQLSGGQRQRVAVARAIAVRSEVLLMDEPLSNLDALLRLEMRAELKRLLAEISATTIYVTHDQIEALSMGDRIAVMRNGKLLQFDSPMKVYDVPADRFVGGFIGSPPMNFLEGQVQRQNGSARVVVNDHVLTPTPEMAPVLAGYDGKPIVVGIRAENMEALAEPAPDALRVKVLVVEPLGSQNLLTIQIGHNVIKVSTHPDFHVAPNQDIWIRFPIDKIRWIDRETGKTLIPDLEKLVTP
ncbi:MAG TPA: ABC transporter ATP-binding protein [Aggregatilinea sp.]|jgi:multiple sugar transport system ATP-binding protein|uniref:ABC transporter ATP-binding protein n=1 Tax=Aggregatilinea sp. TaxID=2806333 RepID=UPI002B7ED87B|nr:ABC transporter ATP-binding protein [Aggregatilinea sp.]HML22853.1 ABC transporter ATP-binding protein [Aggregatilinea sp.]